MKLKSTETTHRTKVYDVMNELDYTPQYFLNVKHLIHSTIDAISHRDYTMAESLQNIALDLLDHYCDTFEKKFKTAWDTTLNTADAADRKQKPDYLANDLLTQDRSSNFPGDLMPPWGHSDMEALKYTEEELAAMCDAAEGTTLTKNKTWVVPIEEDHLGEYYVTFPNELIEKVGWVENDTLEWIDNKDGTFSIKKVKN